MTRFAAIILNAAAACAALVFAPGAAASVRFSDWQAEGIEPLVSSAAREDRLVLVVITQPDWCPPCIRLERDLLGNPEATDIAELTREWTAIEVLGYDSPGAEFLVEQGLKFHGTPTTLLLKPGAPDAPLGQATVLTSINGFPEDYTDTLRRAAGGFDQLLAAQQAMREAPTVTNYRKLGRAYIDQGSATSARRVYRSMLMRTDLEPELRRELEFELIQDVFQRVEKDHALTLRALADFEQRYPDARQDEDFVYAVAWSMLSLGRLDEAEVLIDEAYIAPADPEKLRKYLYLAFRLPSPALLSDAEVEARKGLEAFPEQEGPLSAALGRILRRQGRLVEAEAAFERAVAVTDVGDENYATYLGQLEYVRREMAGDV